MTKLVAGMLTVPEVAVLLGRSERSVWRLRRRYLSDGVDGLVLDATGRQRRIRDLDYPERLTADYSGATFPDSRPCHPPPRHRTGARLGAG
jgi:hypothetical protein